MFRIREVETNYVYEKKYKTKADAELTVDFYKKDDYGEQLITYEIYEEGNDDYKIH